MDADEFEVGLGAAMSPWYELTSVSRSSRTCAAARAARCSGESSNYEQLLNLDERAFNNHAEYVESQTCSGEHFLSVLPW